MFGIILNSIVLTIRVYSSRTDTHELFIVYVYFYVSFASMYLYLDEYVSAFMSIAVQILDITQEVGC